MGTRISMLAVGVLLVTATCFAQLDRGSLSGTVTDSTGGVVPDALVTATQAVTETKLTTKTNEAGVYILSGLAVGTYTVTAEMTGFNTIVRGDVLITAQSSVRVDFTLQPGKVTQQVLVSAPAPLVEERSASYGVSELTSTLNDLPIQEAGSKRSMYSYLATIPGVQNGGFQNNVMGSVGMNSEVVVDGVSAEYNPGVQGVAAGPQSVEALAEFKVVTSVNAEYGLTGGAFMDFVTKSGTNAYHGSAYEFLRNDALDARYYFSPTVPFERQDEFGFTIGGPLVIPHVYDGHNKTFFFGNYQHYLYHNVTAGQVLTLPTAAMEHGDFSALLGPQIGVDKLGRPVLQGQIYNPTTTRSLPDGTVVRDPFPGNVIPSSVFSSVSTSLQSFLPTPTSNAIANNFVGTSGLNITNTDDMFVRVDRSLSKGMFTATFKEEWTTSQPSSVLNPVIATEAHIGTSSQPSVRLAYTLNISPTIVNNINFGFDRNDGINATFPEQLKGATTIGLKNSFMPCTPQTNITGGYPSFGTHFCYQQEADNNFKVNEYFTNVRGKHTLKAGASYFHWNANFPSTVYANGLANFVPAESGLPGFAGTGWGYASFLLGSVDTARLQAAFEKQLREWYTGMFVQDEWRVTPKLTLSYGLRYEIQPQYINNDDSGSQFTPSIPNPGAGGLPGAIEFLGFGAGKANTRRFGNTYYKGFGPRLGFAYGITPKTVLRGSFGLFDAPVSQFSGELAPRMGYDPTFTFASPDGGVTPAFNWTNGYPLVSPVPNLTPTTANGSGVAFMGPDSAHPAIITIVNASFQRELPNNILFEAAYLGNFARHIPNDTLEQINQLNYTTYGSLGSLLTEPCCSAAALAAGAKVPFPGFVGTVAQALRPYPQYLGINGQNSTIGVQNFNALQVKAQKHFGNGLSFLVGYTWSHALTNIGSTPGYFARGIQDAYNQRAEKAPSDVDIPQELVMSYTYELPVGKGKKYLNGDNPVSKYLLGGWTIAGIHTYKSGTPLGPTTEIVLPTTGDSLSLSQIPTRPNVVPGVHPSYDLKCGGGFNVATRYLNLGAFVDPAPFSFGNAAALYDNMRSCGYANEDISLLKTTPIKERLSLQFGADFFNAFNRVQFMAPSTDIDSPSTYGFITSAGNARSVQLHVKLIW